ncbi:MAG: S46 family peptidase [Phycisphaerales bacterium]|nr:S46 family peptidase [Phycisphaerales bacterium]
MPWMSVLRPRRSIGVATNQLLLLLLLLLSLLSPANARAGSELGRMWTFENPPLAYLDEAYGFEPEQVWLDALRLGSLRLAPGHPENGHASASFVSPRGLILTSARSVHSAVAWTKPRDIEMVKIGYVAATRDQELMLQTSQSEPLRAFQLVALTEVTDDMSRGVLPTDTPGQVRTKQQVNRASILAAARAAAPGLEPEIVNLHHGAQFHLYQYKVYDDLRLVVLPHLQVAHFGGDVDDLTYPRHCLDFALLRAYENGEPADTSKHYFRWGRGGADDGDLVFVAGNPGTTSRMLPKAHMEFERDTRVPMDIEEHASGLRILKHPGSGTYVGEFDPENPSRYWAWMRTRILSAEYGLKRARGRLACLTSESLMSRKSGADGAVVGRVMADEELLARYGHLWREYADVMEQRRGHEARARFHTTGASAVLDVAVAIVRLSDPAETELNRARARATLADLSGRTLNTNFHGDALRKDHVIRARNWLPEDDAYLTKIIAARSAEAFLDEMDGDRARQSPGFVGDPVPREALITGGRQAALMSQEPSMIAARELVEMMREDEASGFELDAHEAYLGAEIARALCAAYGTQAGLQGLSPDGTSTLRLSDGIVSGYSSHGTSTPHRTTFRGLFDRNAAAGDAYPFNLPEIWLRRQDRLDMTTTFNFISTNDISEGSVGSVVVNTDLKVVGVVIDRTVASLHNDDVFSGDVPCTVSLHVDAIVEALVKVYDAHGIAEELTGGQP